MVSPERFICAVNKDKGSIMSVQRMIVNPLASAGYSVGLTMGGGAVEV